MAGFVELDHSVFFPDIASSDYYLLSSLKKFLCAKNFSHDDETIDTVKDYLSNLDLEFVCKDIQSLCDLRRRVADA